MNGALPPGAWWITASQGVHPPPAEAYGPHAGLAAVHAAREGPLELQDVSFTYPLRPNMPGAQLPPLCALPMPHTTMQAAVQAGSEVPGR